MDDHAIFPTEFPPQLTYGLDIGQGLNITDCTTDFGDHHIVLVAFPQKLHARLNLVCDMRNHLYGFP